MVAHERTFISIGIFVFGAILLSLIGSFFIYTHYWQGKVETYVMLFNGSLNGLDVTSPITYRGIKIGEVTRIELTENKAKSNVSIPVYVEFFIERSFVQKDNPLHILIENGIVATVTAPNIFTGTARIELIPGKSKKPFSLTRTFHGYAMFPTECGSEVSDLTMNETLQSARKAFQDISRFVASKEFQTTILAIKETAESIDKLAVALDNQVPGVSLYFSDSLRQLSRAAYSTRNLTDYLARHPEALLRGKL